MCNYMFNRLAVIDYFRVIFLFIKVNYFCLFLGGVKTFKGITVSDLNLLEVLVFAMDIEYMDFVKDEFLV